MLEKGVYVTGTIRRDRKFVPTLLPDKAMKRGDINFHFDKDAVICQWFDNKSVVLAGPNIEGIHESSSVLRRVKGKKEKSAVACPNIVKMYNANMGGNLLLTVACKLALIRQKTRDNLSQFALVHRFR